MEDRYWVRHASLQGFVGPLKVSDLRAAVVSRAIPADAEVRRAEPGAPAAALDASGWSQAYALLGLPAPPPPAPRLDLPPPGAPGVRADGVLADLRARSCYRSVRRVVTGLAWLAVLGLVLTRLLALSVTTRAGGGEVGFAVFVELALSLAVVYVLHGAFQMLADVADCHVRRETDASAQRVPPRG